MDHLRSRMGLYKSLQFVRAFWGNPDYEGNGDIVITCRYIPDFPDMSEAVIVLDNQVLRPYEIAYIEDNSGMVIRCRK